MRDLANQPAFPRPTVNNGEQCLDPGASGMTLRQHYAGLAMQGFIASTPDADGNKEFILTSSVEFADGLIAKLQEKGERA